MTGRPNFYFLVPACLAAAGVVALAVLAAEAHGKRRQMRRAWLIERGDA